MSECHAAGVPVHRVDNGGTYLCGMLCMATGRLYVEVGLFSIRPDRNWLLEKDEINVSAFRDGDQGPSKVTKTELLLKMGRPISVSPEIIVMVSWT